MTGPTSVVCLGDEVAGQDYQIPLLNIYGYVAAEARIYGYVAAEAREAGDSIKPGAQAPGPDRINCDRAREAGDSV